MKRMFLWMLRLIGVTAILLAFIPIFRGSAWNLGGITLLGCGILVILYTIFFEWIHTHMYPWIRNGMYALVIFILLLVAIETSCMICAIQKPQGHETVVVLGCRVYGERASRSLVERLDATYEYLIENPKSNCVLSGGQGKGEDISEAECMYEYLKEKGIDENRLFLETESTDTYENLKNSHALIKEKGLEEEIAIVTSEYHQYRSSLIAKKMGITSRSISSRTAWWLLPTYYVRELYGILHQWIFGR